LPERAIAHQAGHPKKRKTHQNPSIFDAVTIKKLVTLVSAALYIVLYTVEKYL